MRNWKLILGVALLAIAACESDVQRLDRLQTEQQQACRATHELDSSRAAWGAAESRANAHLATQADLDQLVNAMRDDSAQLDLVRKHPDQAAAIDRRLHAQRLKCDLATRDLNRFMTGR